MSNETFTSSDFAAGNELLPRGTVHLPENDHCSWLKTCVDAAYSPIIADAQTRDKFDEGTIDCAKTAALFFPGAWGTAATVALYAADGARVGDTGWNLILDAGAAAAKGGLLKTANWGIGKSSWGALQKGVALGMSNRFLEGVLSPDSYFDPNLGRHTFEHGANSVYSSIVNWDNLLSDGVILGGSFLVAGGINRLAGDAIRRSPILGNMLSSGSFGLITGASNEIQTQQRGGGSIHWGQVLKSALVKGGLDALVAVPGGWATPHAAKETSEGTSRQGEKPGKMGYAECKPDQPSGRASMEPEPIPSKRSDYLSDTVLEDGTRLIVKKDGTRVTVKDGKTSVESALPRAAARVAGSEAPSEKAPRLERQQPPDYSHLPENERPLNVGSGNAELIAKEMSNFEHSPFVLDGHRFESVEGFYVWLKWSGNAENQALAEKMYSYEAKRFGKDSTNTTAEYNGQTIELGSPEHHALIKRAIQAKLEQHPDLARRFAETYPRPILHDLGYPEAPSRLPAKDFTAILTDLRQGLVDGTIVTEAGPVDKLSQLAAQREAAWKKFDLSEMMRSLQGDQALNHFPLATYARAFEGFPTQVTGLREVGKDALIFDTADNNVLKVSRRLLPEKFQPRQFLLHMNGSGVVDTGDGLKVQYYLQPRAQTPVTAEQLAAFNLDLARQGFRLSDTGAHQLGVYNGGVKLLDPFGYTKLE